MKKVKINGKRVRRTAAVMMAAALSAGTLSGCSLLPEEETFRQAPTIAEYEGSMYVTTRCSIGEVALTKIISVNYVPVQTENLYFGVNGVNYGEPLVSVGDFVEQGDLIAQLDLGDLEQQSKNWAKMIEEYELSLNQNEQDRSIAIRKAGVQFESDQAEYASQVQKLNQTYDLKRQDISDKLDIARLRYEDYLKQMEERRIYAPFSGTVSYVYEASAVDRSDLARRVLTLVDSSMTLFRGSTDCWDRYESGDQAEITVSGATYYATVRTEADLDIPETPHEEGERGYVYYVLNEPALDLTDSAAGRTVLTLDKRENVLLVPNTAVNLIGGKPAVYYINDKGVRSYKMVETGLVGDRLTEIVSGLEEGEIIIAR